MAEMLEDSINPKKIRIKWPNDIYVDDKKIAGILIENTLKEASIQSSVIGIGINVNQRDFFSGNATSLVLHSDKEFELMQVIERLCEFLEARYLQLKANKLESLDNAYLERLYRFEEWGIYKSVEETFEGKIKGVSKIGKLQMEIRTGEIKEFDLKEISFAGNV